MTNIKECNKCKYYKKEFCKKKKYKVSINASFCAELKYKLFYRIFKNLR